MFFGITYSLITNNLDETDGYTSHYTVFCRYFMYFFGPVGKNPFGAKKSLRVEYSVLNITFQDINSHNIRVHRVWIFPP